MYESTLVAVVLVGGEKYSETHHHHPISWLWTMQCIVSFDVKVITGGSDYYVGVGNHNDGNGGTNDDTHHDNYDC